ncbi:hypothetical protein LF1_10290 [Rubripirellula obstinata]|uniref:Uncharacterized protein n=1 Tax=Rubripirellula obstinata TaxID=406547 RepID=A0A5B1CFL2_9BACT|nr:hypothetical protein [Rubripirellula obstinata]KAA1258509.1 hypothetical protein LF1_10290 [Rubripirellula obstinata]
MPVSFTQSCPTCGRRVQVRASLVGYTIVCQHCRAEFRAKADERINEDGVDVTRLETCADSETETDPLMLRVEEALKRAAAQTPVV